jgi:signal transduction histidine kinase
MEKTDLDNIILSLIYSISSFKTEKDLIEKATPLFLKKFKCNFGVIVAAKEFDVKYSIPSCFIEEENWNILKNRITFDCKNKNLITFKEYFHDEKYFYTYRISKYGFIVLGRKVKFNDGVAREIYDLMEYYGKNLLNAIFENERLANEKIIKNQIKLQDLLINLSAEFINSDLSNIDDLIEKSLKNIGEFVQADRTYIFDYNFEKQNCSNTYEWCSNGILPEIQNLQEISIKYIPYWVEKHKNGLDFSIENVGLLPDDGENGLKHILSQQGIKSLTTIPMLQHNKLTGFVGFDSVKHLKKYTITEKDILFLYSNMLVNLFERKKNEELIKKENRLKESLLRNLENQNKELNDYAHVVSHDLKSPLRNINALINWIKEDNQDSFDNSSKEHFKLILDNIERMDNLIKGILEYSSIDKQKTTLNNVNVNEIIEEILQNTLIPKHIKIKTFNNIPNIYGNNTKIKQIFQNLIQNAILYNNKEDGIIEIGFEIKNNNNIYFVKDNGIGIEKEYHEKIFQTFTKLQNNTQSSGIGLSIVKKIIDSYKGKIWIESKKNFGTTFYFTI